jgi:hypothetical protein
MSRPALVVAGFGAAVVVAGAAVVVDGVVAPGLKVDVAVVAAGVVADADAEHPIEAAINSTASPIITRILKPLPIFPSFNYVCNIVP